MLASSSHRVVAVVSLLAVLAIAGCGGGDAKPTPFPSPPPTVPAVSSTDATPNLSAASPIAPAASPSGSPVAPATVGELADRIAAAWRGIDGYSATFTSATESSDGSQSIASPVVIADSVVLPDRKRRLTTSGDTLVSEFVVIGSAIYARGILIPGITAPADAQSWVKVDPAAFPADSEFRAIYTDLLKPSSAPYSQLAPDERARNARPVGPIEIGGRSCFGYVIADSTNTGDPISVLLALGEDGLPCAIETHVAGTVSQQVFSYHTAPAIDPPSTFVPATVTDPIATPAP